MKKINRENGSVSIEASIALVTFLFLFITIYSFITICRAQARMAVAVDAVAKEISQYSYLYGLTGLNETQAQINEDNQAMAGDINSVIKDLSSTFNGIQSISIGTKKSDAKLNMSTEVLSGEWDDLINQLKATGGSALSAQKTIENMASDPKKLILGMGKMIGSDLFEVIKTNLIADPLARGLIQKNLTFSKNIHQGSTNSCEQYLKSLGIVPRTRYGVTSYLNGLDFSDSTLFQYGSDEIRITVKYRVKMLQLLPIGKDLTFVQTAVTKGWLNGDGTNADGSAEDTAEATPPKENAMGDSIWSTGTAKEISELVRSMGIAEAKKKDSFCSVKGMTYIQLYQPADNEFLYITASNQIYGKTSVDEVNTEDIRNELLKLRTIMQASTENLDQVDIKVTKDLQTKVETVRCSESEKKLTVQLVIPQDQGLIEKYNEVLDQIKNDMGSVDIQIIQSYGTYFDETPSSEEE